MPDTDFDLINRLFSKIVDKQEALSDQALTPEERVVLLIWHASGIIGNGGFQYFYEQDLDAEAVAVAYEKIGCQKCADILRLSLSLFPNATPQAEWNDRMRFLNEKSELLDQLSQAFWEADEAMQPLLAQYVKASIAKE